MVFKVWKLFFIDWTKFFGASLMLRCWVLFWVEMFSKGVERCCKSSFFYIIFWPCYLNLSASRFKWNGLYRPDFFRLRVGEFAIDSFYFILDAMVFYFLSMKFVSTVASSVLLRPGTPWNWNSLLRVLASYGWMLKPLWVNECDTVTGSIERFFAD